ncbi:MAG: methyltransferase [Negativicutes bacterium]|jgi:tRNA1(Val) A37 N6-methylase TrmN6
MDEYSGVPLKDGERLDDLIIGDYKLIQHPAEFCFAIDSVLLGHFATLKNKSRAVDLGSGSGVLGFILLHRGAQSVCGIELNAEMAERSERSIIINGCTDKFSVVATDYKNIREILPAECADLVIANPPYRRSKSGFISGKIGVAMAKHEITADYRDVIDAASYLLSTGGVLAMSHLPERLPEIISYLRVRGFEPKRLRMVHPKKAKNANIVLIESRRGLNPGLTVEAPLIIYESNGEYSAEIKEYYQNDNGISKL